MESLRDSGVPATLYDRVRVEPSDESFLDAIAFARDGGYDAFVAVGGGSTIDTAKAVNLYTTYPPADFLDYVNPPIGKGLPVPGPLKTLIAIPTTAGTGSETTGVSIFDYRPLHAKTGIANRRLKPTLGFLDPENTRTMPPEVAASTGLDILSHAIESYTAMPFTDRPRPGPAVLAAGVPGIESNQRRLVDGGAAHGVAVPRPRGRRSVRRRGARADAAGGVLRRCRIRQCRSAPAARHVVSGLGQREELSGARLRRRPPARAARHLGHPQRAGVFRFTASASPERHLQAAEALGA
jgi:hydroxyacid-oxoacid transhydrogenase